MSAKFLQLKEEPNPWNEDAVAIFAYFEGTPSKEDLLTAFRSRYKKLPPEEASFEPRVFEAPEIKEGIERWYLCQAV